MINAEVREEIRREKLEVIISQAAEKLSRKDEI